MEIVKSIVNEAVREYNRTIFRKNSLFHEKDTYFEKRGIFYNCLRRQFSYRIPNYRFSNCVNVADLVCFFRENGSIERFVVNSKPTSWNLSSEYVEILNDIISLSNVEYIDTEVYISFDSIKNFQFKPF